MIQSNKYQKGWLRARYWAYRRSWDSFLDQGREKPDVHGHTVLLEYLQRHPPVGNFGLTEVGTTRELLPGQGSTLEMAAYCVAVGGVFTTIDMDPLNSRQVAPALEHLDPERTRVITGLGEVVLAAADTPVDVVYLDAFDVEDGRHTEHRRSRYRDILNTEITDHASAEMHFACAVVLEMRQEIGAVVCFDDTPVRHGIWSGKGASAVPFLLGHGYMVAACVGDTVVLVRVGANPHSPQARPGHP